MRSLVLIASILFSAKSFAVTYYTCSRAIEEGKDQQFVFSDDGKMSEFRLILTERDGNGGGAIIEIEKKSFTATRDRFDFEGYIAEKADDDVHKVEVVVQKNTAHNQFEADYTDVLRDENFYMPCVASNKIDRHINDGHFWRFTKITPGSLKCSTDTESFVFNHNAKQIWVQEQVYPSGAFNGFEHVINRYLKTQKGYEVISIENAFTGRRAYAFVFEFDQAANRWNFTATRDRSGTEAGTCVNFN